MEKTRRLYSMRGVPDTLLRAIKYRTEQRKGVGHTSMQEIICEVLEREFEQERKIIQEMDAKAKASEVCS